MVPNHTGIDSAWVRERPELFIQSEQCPFPGYRFDGGDLSGDGRVGIWLEDHYYDRTDAAVVFKRLDRATGRVSYVYHGNDGTGLPWSDTAQIDFLSKDAREAVKERILHVARNFPIIRFDAAMIMARKHFRRLWYPEPGSGGDVPSRSDTRARARRTSTARCPRNSGARSWTSARREAPDTLLLAEAFWMMEGYFVRTLGMHRVYNSAFMNMLKREENAKYRETIRNTQEFDKDILKRFVNFMNNPDEETAVAQFGKGDKYFGVCTMMATMPGLPMFGHGQLEGFEEKYGMEYRRAYRDEIARPRPHRAPRARDIPAAQEAQPLLRSRALPPLRPRRPRRLGQRERIRLYERRRRRDGPSSPTTTPCPAPRAASRDSCSFAEKSPDGQKRVDAHGPRLGLAICRRRARLGRSGALPRHARAALRALVHPPLARARRRRPQAHPRTATSARSSSTSSRSRTTSAACTRPSTMPWAERDPGLLRRRTGRRPQGALRAPSPPCSLPSSSPGRGISPRLGQAENGSVAAPAAPTPKAPRPRP